MSPARPLTAISFALLSPFAIALSGCEKKSTTEEAPETDPAHVEDADAPLAPSGWTDAEAPLAPSGWTDAEAPLVGPNGEDMGRVIFSDGAGGVLMRIEAHGLAPGWHGIHLHMVADCSDGAAGFKASGAHVDPEDHEHGLINPDGSERGDLPNLYADANGEATAEYFPGGLHLSPSEQRAAANGPFPLMDDDGSAVIIHANADDHTTQPIGGAGDRVACAALKAS